MEEASGIQSRRGFLTYLAGATLATLVVDWRKAPSVLAANDPPLELLPDYISGVVTSAAADQIEIFAPGYGEPHAVRLAPATQTCRGSCERTWKDIAVEDRVEAGTFDALDGVRVAKFVNVNPVYSWGLVDRVERNRVHVKHMAEMPFTSGPERDLLVGPTTEVRTLHGIAVGDASHVEPGDMLHFSGATQGPRLDDGPVIATVIIDVRPLSYAESATGPG
jgi:hypothetical protein